VFCFHTVTYVLHYIKEQIIQNLNTMLRNFFLWPHNYVFIGNVYFKFLTYRDSATTHCHAWAVFSPFVAAAAVQAGPRHGEVPLPGESKSAAPTPTLSPPGGGKAHERLFAIPSFHQTWRPPEKCRPGALPPAPPCRRPECKYSESTSFSTRGAPTAAFV